ncbi:MAG TPA: T9SS type A sorting domain-containing protein [Saprospiraceae bacterium]|nr:T9SS type A sorting domain-containing protein [Saprospiraceae bacterium]
MKKILLLLVVSIYSIGAFAFVPDATLHSKKNNKTYYFDFSEKKYLRYNGDTKAYEGTFDMSNFSSNWNSVIGNIQPTAVFQSPSGDKVYFLDTKNNTYLRHDWSNSSIDAGWPKSLSHFDSGWPSNWKGANYRVTGAFFNNSDGWLYLFDFSKEKFVAYRWSTDTWTPTLETSSWTDYSQVDINMKYSNSASYDDTEETSFFYKFSTLSFATYYWNTNKFGRAFELTRLGEWPDEWADNVYNGDCTIYFLQGNLGRRLFPAKVDLPQGVYGDDYKLKKLSLNLQTQGNDSIAAYLLSPYDFPNTANRMLFEYGYASGDNFGGSNCTSLVNFSDSGDYEISSGSAPYINANIKPHQSFYGIADGTKVNGYWYLKVYSKSKLRTDMFKKFTLEFEPARTLECGVSETYSAPAGDGKWDMSSVCGTPQGIERLYKFTPTNTGEHFIILQGGSGYHDYYYKSSTTGLNSSGWQCPTTNDGQTLSLGTLNAGETYYILDKPETNTGTSSTFYIECASCQPVTGLENDAGSNTGLGFTWYPSPSASSYAWEISTGGTVVQSGTTSQNSQFSVNNLTPGTEYTFTVKTDCGGGWFSSPVSVNATTSSVCNEPFNLSLDGSGFTNLDFAWDGPANGVNYVWQIKSGAVLVNSGSTATTGQIVEGLLPGTSYTFYLKTDCGGGLFSSVVSLAASTAECQVPTGLTTSNISSIGFTVTAAPNSSTIKKWQVVPAGNGIGNGIVAQGELSGNVFNVSGLSASTAYDFYLQSKCDDQYSDPASLLNINTIVGVEELSNINGINLYPSPAKDVLNISLSGNQAASLEISITNLLGKNVQSKKLQLNQGLNIEQFDVSDLQAGIYLVRITDQGKTVGFRFVKE